MPYCVLLLQVIQQKHAKIRASCIVPTDGHRIDALHLLQHSNKNVSIIQ